MCLSTKAQVVGESTAEDMAAMAWQSSLPVSPWFCKVTYCCKKPLTSASLQEVRFGNWGNLMDSVY